MSFSKAIREIRKSAFLSQETFAQTLGVSFTTVNRWESGKCVPSYKAKKLIDDYCKSNGIDFDINKVFPEGEQNE